jgi:hypothetical protein
MKKFVFGMVFAFLMVCLYAQNTSDFEIQGNDDGTMTILNYKGMAKDIVIPENIFNMPVTRLREGAFKNKNLTSVVIPNTVSFIGDETFSQNQLSAVTIPQTVEYIGDNAFSSNRLATITIPGNVIVIGAGAFRSNQLSSITIPNSVTFIGTSAFRGNSITSIMLGSGVLYIGSGAFYDHRATSIVIPNNVVYIGTEAFEPERSGILTSITIGKYVMLQDNDAFSDGTGNFDTIYKNNDKRPGKYTYSNNNWSYAQ